MSKITYTKLNRLFSQPNSRNNILVRREEPISHVTMSPGDCEFCGLPVIANGGQVLTFRNGGDKKYYSHKACRKGKNLK